MKCKAQASPQGRRMELQGETRIAVSARTPHIRPRSEAGRHDLCPRPVPCCL